MTSTIGLTFGAFDLFGDGPTYRTETLAEGTDKGSPEPIEVAIRSLLQDGSVLITQGYDNRTVTIRCTIMAADSVALSDGEKDLFAEIGKPNELTYTPADGWSDPTVFDVVTSSLLPVEDDLAEIRGERVYVIRLVCRPFGRSTTRQTFTPTATPSGTLRQNAYSLDIAGSAPTEADLHVVGSTGLGLTLIYTRPGAQGMIPLRPYRVGGATGTTSASGNVSGRYDNNIATPFVSQVSKSDVPDGTYIVVALVRKESGSGAVALSSSVTTRSSGVGVAAADTRSTSSTLTTAYSLVQLGSPFQVPSAVLPDEGVADIEVSISAGAATRLDEAWLIEVGSGDLTWLDSASTFGVDAKHFWIEQPTTARPSRRIVKGVFADQAAAFGATPVRWGFHRLEPGTNGAFVVTTGSTTTVLDGSCENRWFTHAGTV